MGLMSDAGEWCWLLMIHGCQAMPILGWHLAESLALNSNTASQVTCFLASLWAELGKILGVSLKLGKLWGILGFSKVLPPI
jgi:hypothetical protein